MTAEQVTAMTGAVDLTTIIVGLIAIGTAYLLVNVAWYGISKLRGAAKGRG